MSYGSLGGEWQGPIDIDSYPKGPVKSRESISTAAEAGDYAAAGYKFCIKQTRTALWADAADRYMKAFMAFMGSASVAQLLPLLRAADSVADQARRLGTRVTPSTKPQIDTSPASPEPPGLRSAGFMGGMPWWAFVGAGAAVYFMVKKGKKSPSRRKSAPRRKRPSRSSKRPRSLQRRRRRGY